MWYRINCMFGPGSQSKHEEFVWRDSALTDDDREEIGDRLSREYAQGGHFRADFTVVDQPPRTVLHGMLKAAAHRAHGAASTLLRLTAEPQHVFQSGNFTLASGKVSKLKIECDAYTDDDLRGFATMAGPLLRSPSARPFARIVGVPNGGLRFAQILSYNHDYRTFGKGDVGLLIVEDVITTGGSVLKVVDEHVKKGRPVEHLSVLAIHYRNKDVLQPGHPKLVYEGQEIPTFALNITNCGDI